MSQFSVNSAAATSTLRPFLRIALQARSEEAQAAASANAPTHFADTPRDGQGYNPMAWVDTTECHSALSDRGLASVLVALIDSLPEDISDAEAKDFVLQLITGHKRVAGLPDNRIPVSCGGWDATFKSSGKPYVNITSNRLGMGARRADEVVASMPSAEVAAA